MPSAAINTNGRKDRARTVYEQRFVVIVSIIFLAIQSDFAPTLFTGITKQSETETGYIETAVENEDLSEDNTRPPQEKYAIKIGSDSDDGLTSVRNDADEEISSHEQEETSGDNELLVIFDQGEELGEEAIINTPHVRPQQRKNMKKNGTRSTEDNANDGSNIKKQSIRPFLLDTKILEQNEFKKPYDVSKAEANDPLLNILPSSYRKSEKLPVWMKEYFDWHRIQTASMNEENWISSFEYYNATKDDTAIDEEKFVANNRKFLVARCLSKERCGGLSDRIKPLLLYAAAAAHQPTGLNGKEHRRILLIRWQRPYPLEEFLVPNEVNWTIPSYMEEFLDRMDRKSGPITFSRFRKRINYAKKFELFSEDHEDITMMEVKFQTELGGSDFYQHIIDTLYGVNGTNDIRHNDVKRFWIRKPAFVANRKRRAIHSWHKVYRTFFRTMFKPSEPVRALIESKMTDLKLIPGEFIGVHYRADYGMGEAERAGPELIKNTAITVANCAALVAEGSPIYFASDTTSALQALEDESEALSARNITVVTPIAADVAAMENGITNVPITPLHIEWDKGAVEQFYSTFVDLLVMSESKCQIYGEGGFGHYASLMSHNASCWYNFATMCDKPEEQLVPSPLASVLPSECCIPHEIDRKASVKYRREKIKKAGHTMQLFGNSDDNNGGIAKDSTDDNNNEKQDE